MGWLMRGAGAGSTSTGGCDPRAAFGADTHRSRLWCHLCWAHSQQAGAPGCRLRATQRPCGWQQAPQQTAAASGSWRQAAGAGRRCHYCQHPVAQACPHRTSQPSWETPYTSRWQPTRPCAPACPPPRPRRPAARAPRPGGCTRPEREARRTPAAAGRRRQGRGGSGEPGGAGAALEAGQASQTACQPLPQPLLLCSRQRLLQHLLDAGDCTANKRGCANGGPGREPTL
jgi:hypothetical protein